MDAYAPREDENAMAFRFPDRFLKLNLYLVFARAGLPAVPGCHFHYLVEALECIFKKG